MSNNIFSSLIGVAWGLNQGNPNPTIANAIPLIQQAGFQWIRLYEANQTALQAATKAKLEICLGTTEDRIATLAKSVDNAEKYVEEYVVPSAANVKAICVGNEVFYNNVYSDIVPAVKNLHQALTNQTLNSIKVTTSITMGATQNSYPPQNTSFKPPYIDTATALLDYLGSIDSFVFLDAYPFHAILDNPIDITLAYALLEESITVGGQTFDGLFDAQYVGFQQAIQKLKLGNSPDIYIGETGWASAGSPTKAHVSKGNPTEEVIASVANEKTYWDRYITYANKNQLPTLMFEMFDEPAKPNNKYGDPYYGIYDTNSGNFKFTIDL